MVCKNQVFECTKYVKQLITIPQEQKLHVVLNKYILRVGNLLKFKVNY